MSLLELIRKLPTAPGFLSDKVLDKVGQAAEIPEATFPTPIFASRRANVDGRNMPQAIAHRGHKVDFPENSLRAFEAAIEAGADAIETDIHLSKDKVVVLSHDSDLKRCFGVDKRISDCNWEYLKTLQTTRKPSQPLACLEDLLHLLVKDSAHQVWLMLDIKVRSAQWDDDPEELMFYTAEAFHKIGAGNSSAWKDRVVLGYWTAPFVPLCYKYFPDFPIANIGFCPPVSSQFLQVSASGFSMFQGSVALPNGHSFVRHVQAQGRQVYAWTVNDEKNMDLCIRRDFDGVITDDVAKFRKVCDAFREEKQPTWPIRILLSFVYLNFWVMIFSALHRKRYGTSLIGDGSVSKKCK